MPTQPLMGVDIGGTGIKAAPVDLDAGTFTAERVREPTPSPATPDAVAAVVARIVSTFEVDGPIGLTLPAVVRDGTVLTASNIDQGWIGTDATALFAEATGRHVAVVNDADAAGMAEVRYGAGRGFAGLVVLVTLGTGIGSALFHGGTLIPNAELGHLRVHGKSAEKWASESAREREGLSWTEWARRLSVYLGRLEKLLWPELFIIGGGVSRQADKFVPHLECSTPVVAAQLHNDAGIVGAAMVAPVDDGTKS
jgi:polyphosphate glucokinase